MAVASKQQYIPLKWSEKDHKMVVVEDKDKDRFCLTLEAAIAACKAYDTKKRALVRNQFDNLLNFLGDWCYKRRKKLAKVFLTIRDAGLLFLVITNRKTYDEEFENELTNLDIKVAHEDSFSEICLSVQALPLCDAANYDSFCHPERTLEYVGLNANRI